MNILHNGDYVKNLTKEQFNELVSLDPKSVCTYTPNDKDTSLFFANSLLYLSDTVIHCIISVAAKQLTFDQFKERLINTQTLKNQ